MRITRVIVIMRRMRKRLRREVERGEENNKKRKDEKMKKNEKGSDGIPLNLRRRDKPYHTRKLRKWKKLQTSQLKE